MSSFYQLHEIAKVEPYLLTKDLEKRIDAFITSRLDYCNSLFLWVFNTHLSIACS